MKHRVIVEYEVEVGKAFCFTTWIEAVLEQEEVAECCEVNVLVADNSAIHQINLDMRGVDKPTDVLSFPMFDLMPGKPPDASLADPESGLVPLGDLVISLEQATAQGVEYGHSTEQEMAYLTVHSMLHLLGYDHLDEGEQKQKMRMREKIVMQALGYNYD